MCVYANVCTSIYIYLSIRLSMYLTIEKWARKINKQFMEAEIQMTTQY